MARSPGPSLKHPPCSNPSERPVWAAASINIESAHFLPCAAPSKSYRPSSPAWTMILASSCLPYIYFNLLQAIQSDYFRRQWSRVLLHLHPTPKHLPSGFPLILKSNMLQNMPIRSIMIWTLFVFQAHFPCFYYKWFVHGQPSAENIFPSHFPANWIYFFFKLRLHLPWPLSWVLISLL